MTNPSIRDSVEVFQDIQVICTGISSASLTGDMQLNVKHPWRHAKEVEEQMLGTANRDLLKMSVYERCAWDGLPGARVVVFEEVGKLKISHVTPTEIERLDERAYNDVLNDFVERVVQPAQHEKVRVELSKRRQSITDWTSEEAADALHEFSIWANRRTGAINSEAARKWRDFLIADFRAAKGLSEYNLRRWLVVVEKWPEFIARELSSEHSKAIELLTQYEHAHQ